MKAKTGLFVSYVLQIVSLFLPWFTYNAHVMGYCWGTQYVFYFLIPLILIGIYLFSMRTGIVHIILAEFGSIMYIILLVLVFGNWQEGRNIVSGFHWADGFRTAQPGFWLAVAAEVFTFVFIQYHVFFCKSMACTPKEKRCALLTTTIAILLTVISFAVFSREEVQLLNAESTVYSYEEIDDAARCIKDKVAEWKGCKLYSIWYAGDETSFKELDYCNTLNNTEEAFTQCMVFQTDLRSPIFGGGAWNPNTHYDWSWYLAKTDEGEWELLTWGDP